MRFLFSVLIAALICSPLSGAGIRGRRVIQHHSHHRDNIIVNQLVYDQKIVEGYLNAPLQVVAVPVTGLGPDYYWTDGVEEIRNMRISDEDVTRITDSIMKRFKEEFAVNGDETVPVEPEPDQPVAEIDELTAKVEAIFVNNCVTCHGDNTQNGFTLVSKVGDIYVMADLDKLTRWNIYDRVQGGAYLPVGKRMPKNQEPLSTEDVEYIQQWAREAK